MSYGGTGGGVESSVERKVLPPYFWQNRICGMMSSTRGGSLAMTARETQSMSGLPSRLYDSSILFATSSSCSSHVAPWACWSAFPKHDLGYNLEACKASGSGFKASEWGRGVNSTCATPSVRKSPLLIWGAMLDPTEEIAPSRPRNDRVRCGPRRKLTASCCHLIPCMGY